jgi:protoheme IX farnesyltransferase
MPATFLTYATLGRPQISLFAGFSAMLGYILAAYYVRTGMFETGLGVFLISCGSSGFNQCQEQKTDANGAHKKQASTGGSVASGGPNFPLCVLAGLLSLLVAGGIEALCGGLFAISWYNGLYTVLKKRTAFATVPGALVGAIPPAIGWIAGGGSYADPILLALCLFFFLWQVPHFWLLAVACGRQYEQAGLPSLTGVFSEVQLRRIIFVWISATAKLSFLSATGIVRSATIHTGLIALSACSSGMASGTYSGRALNTVRSLSLKRQIITCWLSCSFFRLISCLCFHPKKAAVH